MEKDFPIGNVGDVDCHLENGVASVTLKLKEPKTGLKVTVGIEIDTTADLELLKAAIVAKYPSSTIIVEAVFNVIEKALKSA
jgi:hypothetical protein